MRPEAETVPCNVTPSSGYYCSDIWGWTDPENGDEYAIMGLNWGTSFVRITDPENPVVVAYLSTKYVSFEFASNESSN